MGNKFEKDLRGCFNVLARNLGVDPEGMAESIGFNVRKTAGDVPDPAEPSAQERVCGDVFELEECTKCKTHGEKGKACAVCDSQSRPSYSPVSPAPSSAVKPSRGAHEPSFYCAFDTSGEFLGAFVSPYQAHQASKGGNVRFLPASEIPQ